MTTRPTDAQIISRALVLLHFSVLASALPDRLMKEFNLPRERARKLAGRAIKQYRNNKGIV